MTAISIPAAIPYTERVYRPGQAIIDGLRPSDTFYILTSGTADVIYRHVDGETFCVYRYQAPDFFGEVEVLTDLNQPLPVVAAERCVVRAIKCQDARRWLRQDQDFSFFVMRRLCEKLYDNMSKWADQRFLSQRQRLLAAYRCAVRDDRLDSLTKADLCQQLGMPLRSLNRVIAQCTDVATYSRHHFHAATKGGARGR